MPKPKTKEPNLKITSVQLNERDDAILAALCEHQEMTRSDILRRAVRRWATELGIVEPKSPPKVATL